jgi:hypothetical protein
MFNRLDCLYLTIFSRQICQMLVDLEPSQKKSYTVPQRIDTNAISPSVRQTCKASQGQSKRCHDIHHNNIQHNAILSKTALRITTVYCAERCVFTLCYAECRYAKCRYAGCRHSECHGVHKNQFL